MYKTVKDMYIGDNQQLKVKLVRGWQRTQEDYCHHNKIGDNPINLFTEDMHVGETWNGYRAIAFKVIEDLFMVADTVRTFFFFFFFGYRDSF